MNYTVLIVIRIKLHGHTINMYLGIYLPSFDVEINTPITKSDLSKSHGKDIFYFSATKRAFGVNPRDVVHRDRKLATDGARMMIASGFCLHKQSGRGRHFRHYHQ